MLFIFDVIKLVNKVKIAQVELIYSFRGQYEGVIKKTIQQFDRGGQRVIGGWLCLCVGQFITIRRFYLQHRFLLFGDCGIKLLGFWHRQIVA
jgi:hypothetical protein